MHAYVAWSKSNNLHSIARVVPKALVGATLDDESSLDAINALASSKSLPKLLQAVESMPTLLPDIPGSGRVVPIENARGHVNELFGPCKLEYLADEASFDANTDIRPDERGARAAASARDATKGGLEGDLAIADPESSCLVVEPLLDWVSARNAFGVVARLSGLIEGGDTSGIMGRAGFALGENRRLSEEIWMIPFSYNPFFAPFSTSFYRYQPLLSSLTSERVEKVGGPTPLTPESISYNDLGSGNDVYLLTAPIAKDQPMKLRDAIFNKKGIEEKRFYLCAKDDGTQLDVASRIIRSFFEATRDLKITPSKKKGEPILAGWALDWIADPLDTNASSPDVRVKRLSLFADLMYRLYYRGDERISICAECGCAILQPNRGPLREFCSNACRMRNLRRQSATS